MNIYIKKGRRYEKLGKHWEGFPANGIWLVWNSRENCLIQLEDLDNLRERNRHLDLTMLRAWEDDIATVLVETHKEMISPIQVARRITDRIWEKWVTDNKSNDENRR